MNAICAIRDDRPTTPTPNPLRGFSGLPIHQHQLRAGIEHAISLGTRPLCEFIVQIAEEERDLAGMLDLLKQWRDRLSPEIVRAVGGAVFPSRPIRSAVG